MTTHIASQITIQMTTRNDDPDGKADDNPNDNTDSKADDNPKDNPDGNQMTIQLKAKFGISADKVTAVI
jgi:hypothetical protein